MESRLSFDNSFWRFSLAVYSVSGVADECIALQERYDIDVNVLLFCAWIGRVRAVTLTPADIDAIGSTVAAWREGVVEPLRTVRRSLKQLPDRDGGALRAQVKASELKAEKVEQAMLYAYAEQRWPVGSDGFRSDAIGANLELLLRAHGWHERGRECSPIRHLFAGVLAFEAHTGGISD